MINVANRRENITARIFGDGPQKPQLEDMVARADLQDRISIETYSEELWHSLATASVFVSLSAYEGQPNVVLEAAAIWCPMVLSDIPAHKEALRGGGARFIAQHSADVTAEAIIDTIDDEGATRRLVLEAQNAVSGLSVTECARNYKSLYQRLLSSHDDTGST